MLCCLSYPTRVDAYPIEFNASPLLVAFYARVDPCPVDPYLIKFYHQ